MVPSPKSHAYEAIVPSESLDADASNEHASKVHEGVKAATGVALIALAERLSNVNSTGAFVVVELSVVCSPTEPAAWMPACESVRVTANAAGSDRAAFQILTLIVVGFAPVTSTRNRYVVAA